MTKTSTKGYWAIRIGDYIEFRYGPKPLRVVSTLKRYGFVVLKQVSYVGGEILGGVDLENSYPLAVRPGGRTRVTKKLMSEILGRAHV